VRLADPGAEGIPRTFIECTNDRVIPLDSQRRMQAARPCGRVAGLATGHSPFFAAPAALAALLARA
jgi:pimeloyl-ACP methyl ester carboxylesterase